MTPIILSAPVESIASAQQSSIEHRDGILALAKPITEVKTQDQLEATVKVLAELAAITKETELARKTVKEPVLALGKKIDAIAAEFVASVEKEKARLTGYVNHFQTLQLREKEERERKARAEAEKAQREAEAAQREIERLQREAAEKANTAAQKAKLEEDLLDAQLRAESAALSGQQAEAQLSIPTNTPRGLTTRTRYNFQILNPVTAYANASEFWNWRADEECLKFDRAAFLKVLNGDDPQDWLPADGNESVTKDGIRVFRETKASFRA